MDKKSILDPSFQYDGSVDAKSERNYLAEKWDKLYPGWNRKPGNKTRESVRVVSVAQIRK